MLIKETHFDTITMTEDKDDQRNRITNTLFLEKRSDYENKTMHTHENT